MLFNNWRAEAARIAAGMYGVELDRIPKEYLWRLWRGDVSVWGRLPVGAPAPLPIPAADH
jgi:hypothetical protein